MTTGVHRLRAMGEAGKLLYPVMAVNDADEADFDNVYGTASRRSTASSARRTSSWLGRTVVAGYAIAAAVWAMRAAVRA